MTAPAEEITRAALTFSVEERTTLASTLLASLDEPADDPAEVEAAWAVEIDHRARNVLSGNVQGTSWESVKAELTARRPDRA